MCAERRKIKWPVNQVEAKAVCLKCWKLWNVKGTVGDYIRHKCTCGRNMNLVLRKI